MIMGIKEKRNYNAPLSGRLSRGLKILQDYKYLSTEGKI